MFVFKRSFSHFISCTYENGVGLVVYIHSNANGNEIENENPNRGKDRY